MILSQRSDIVLAFLLLSVVFMMILPLPTLMVDSLIGVNLCISAILLMVAVYISDVTQFSAFPSILLLTTLFRLALSITTTRLILLQADAGQIVETFGNFVVSGNLIVGIVIFLIVTIVNFLVITKGSERVAEVSARFSLDALPGKQMSIDSDIRSGLIDMEEAKRRRTKLGKESQLYGAMDGAMKFVKGDAIAGLIIIAVNIIGGILIGTNQRGMSTSEALDIYALLTIGDGLVAQIPALFISITAGFIVTRVSSEENTDLGSDITYQLVKEPKALLIASGILLGFAAIPGFPPSVFLSLSFLCGAGGIIIIRNRKNVQKSRTLNDLPSFAPAVFGDGNVPSFPEGDDAPGGAAKAVTFQLTIPLMVDISSAVRGAIRPEVLDQEVARVRKALYFDLGVPFPGINLRLNDNLREGEYRIMVNEIPVAAGRARPGFFIARETEANLDMFGIPYEVGEAFLPRTKSLWVAMKHQTTAKSAGIQVLTLTSMLTFHLAHVLKSHASEFVGIQETMYVLSQMETDFAELVKEVSRVLPVTTIADVLQRLVSEEICIRDTRTILQCLVEWGAKEKDPIMLTEHVRTSLSRYITYKFSAGQNIVPAYLLSKGVEDEIRAAVRQTSGASYLALSPELHRQLVSSIKQTVTDQSLNATQPAIIAPMDLRRFVRKIVERDFPDLPVLSFQELSADVNIQPLDRISIDDQSALLQMDE
ncbi:low calcium response protein [Stappia aggregata IAM 12614]|uniref:Low calcium response protein n=1 Tax=Roseibium aggregatum (strain ATCC 25650 / DSM 13394 / JCM 20685 / NBRC 16684 / NCIMB 2208 / IAM 12614 / B1) TaxID=384765 RepID=A0P0K4_ROSAI|nr:type III secretion system export apparatus subunit SctV [Roseibium aggregatum]EAV41318.1 low calcium response protein [Stappia aggregata IAM 12614] [Roseibium aggregatum IAM 12614]